MCCPLPTLNKSVRDSPPLLVARVPSERSQLHALAADSRPGHLCTRLGRGTQLAETSQGLHPKRLHEPRVSLHYQHAQ